MKLIKKSMVMTINSNYAVNRISATGTYMHLKKSSIGGKQYLNYL
jgi:hypothetical protein